MKHSYKHGNIVSSFPRLGSTTNLMQKYGYNFAIQFELNVFLKITKFLKSI